jgi:putative ABC transport system ATP-binding protein
MLALSTVQGSLCAASRWPSNATQPLPRARPNSAEMLSPTTTISWPALALAGAHPRPAPSAAARLALKCRNLRRDVRALKSDCMSESIIVVEHLTRQVSDATGTLTILHDISFTLNARESAAIVGASGSGKSTLLGLLAGLDVPTSGSVRMAGSDLFTLSEDQRAAVRAERVGFVFQSFQLLAHRTALENVMLPLELAGARDARARATEMLARVGLGARLNHYPRVLSGGEQQRVALARAFVVRPQVLLADEPTGSLDFATGETVMQLMFDLNREVGTTLVLVTHDTAIAARCDRQLHIEAGRLVDAVAA